jgi:hypothetical protein
MSKFIDLTGQTFGKLTVTERAEDFISSKGNKYIQWRCMCNCKPDNPNYITVVDYSLKRGFTRSCGCPNYNKYDLTGEYGIGYTEKGQPFYFDLEDYDKIKDYCWKQTSEGYISSCYRFDNKYILILMHRHLINAKKGEEVDHIYHDIFDNRKEKLRIVTKSQNAMNQIISIRNKSGTKGVHWSTRANQWVARIRKDGEMVQKYFKDKSKAIEYRKFLEEKYHKEYAIKENSQAQGGTI